MDDDYCVKEMDYRTALDLVIKHHYLHRKPPYSKAFGLYFDECIVGVIVFGKPASYTLCKGLCGEDESKNVVEFNRLWTLDNLPRNAKSWFISKAIKLSGFEILVSFADTSQGHIGYVYQASNWLYTGESKPVKYFRLKGTSTDKNYKRRERMTKVEILRDYGEHMLEEFYSPLKHRYVYFNASRKRKKELMGKLRYNVHSYPKEINK